MFLKTNKFHNFSLLILICSAIIVTLIALIIEFITSTLNIFNTTNIIENPNHLWVPSEPWGTIWNVLSTFTIQSNILVLIFFILIFINHFKKKKSRLINSLHLNLAITTYITITMIIFWSTLFKSLLESTDFQTTLSLLIFINTFLLHLITPIITIAFFFLTAGDTKWFIKSITIKTLPLTLSYMFLYLFYILIKGTFIGQIKIKQDKIFVDYSYPYFFLNIKTNLDLFFLYFFIILILFLIIFMIYYFYNNWKYQRKYAQKTQNKK